ncbi:uncharacterized protein LOC141631244 [Silene latifolia]|uniref:uncharacterized protein LOC141631244 n=1 Tax=Silene latifolia TaxID=37657 RepID=UPI003D77FC1F
MLKVSKAFFILGMLVSVSWGVKNMPNNCVSRGHFSVSKAYDGIGKHYPTIAVFKAIKQCTVVSRHRVTLMLVAQSKLATIDLLASKGLPIVNRCYSCKAKAETAHHLFFHCQFSIKLLKHIKQWFRLTSASNDLCFLHVWTNQRKQKRRWKNSWISCCLGSMVYSIWQERNLRAFENRERQLSALIKEVQSTVNILLLSKVSENVYGEVVKALNT